MPTPTYDLIDSQVLSTSAASVTFSSIPATYRDLVLVGETLHATTTENNTLQFNSDTGSNYSNIYAYGTGSTTGSSAQTLAYIRVDFATEMSTTNKNLFVVNVMDYSATDKHKTTIGRSNNSAVAVEMTAGRWANTAAINTIRIAPRSGSYAAGSTFYLYGIAS